MKIDAQHLALVLILALSLVGSVTLAITHTPAPEILVTIETATAGALFGITRPNRGE
jgi:uncharacterized membrane protein AbrB (regulator of aidB expression)